MTSCGISGIGWIRSEPGGLDGASSLDAAVKQALAGRPELSETGVLQVAINQLDQRLERGRTRGRGSICSLTC